MNSYNFIENLGKGSNDMESANYVLPYKFEAILGAAMMDQIYANNHDVKIKSCKPIGAKVK
jgi:hypothetical protein